MADRKYIYSTGNKTPLPRSKRLRECGGGSSSSTVVTRTTYTGDSGSSGGSGGDYLPLTGGTMYGDIILGTSGARITAEGHIMLASGVEIW